MTTTTHKKARFGTALTAVLAALALAAPISSAAPQTSFIHYSIAGDTRLASPLVAPPPRLGGRHMHWFRWHPSARALQGRAGEFGSVAVLGLESMRDLASLRGLYGFDRVLPIPGLHAAEVSVTAAQLHALLTNAPGDERIRYVAPVGPQRKLLRLRNDPMLRTTNAAISAPYEWQFAASRVDRALNLSQGSPMILVGTVDSGIGDVPDLAGKVDARWTFATNGPPNTQKVANGFGFDIYGHGTGVGSLIAANVDDGFGMAGFGGATHLVSFRDDFLNDTTIALALEKLVSVGCRIVNMSLGGPDPSSPILHDSINKALIAGVLIVAATGNEGNDSVSYPAADLQPADGADSLGLAVGASDFSGHPASWANHGSNLSLVAPGDYNGGCSGVLVAVPPAARMVDNTCWPTFTGTGGGRYASVAGTSFSSPEVAGVAALVWAARPDLRNYEVADIIKRSARRDPSTGWTPTAGYGVLDAAAALELATGRSSADALTVSGFRTIRANRRLTATGRVAWTDGVAPDDARVSCAASVDGTVIHVAAQTFSHGTFTCRWDLSGVRGGKLTGTVTITESHSGVSVSQPFAAALADHLR